MSEPEAIVYVVDDDASVRKSLERLLESVGLRAELFASAKAFLDYNRPDSPACLVLDVRLPGLSGMDLQRELAASNTRIPIIFISGHGDLPIFVREVKAGVVDFLPKPYRDQNLLDAIHKALELDRQTRLEQDKTGCLIS